MTDVALARAWSAHPAVNVDAVRRSDLISIRNAIVVYCTLEDIENTLNTPCTSMKTPSMVFTHPGTRVRVVSPFRSAWMPRVRKRKQCQPARRSSASLCPVRMEERTPLLSKEREERLASFDVAPPSARSAKSTRSPLQMTPSTPENFQNTLGFAANAVKHPKHI